MALFHTKNGFLKAAEAGDTALLKEYLAMPGKKWCATRDKRTRQCALHKAAVNGRLEAVKLLLAQPAMEPLLSSFDRNSDTPLALAVGIGYRDVVREMLANKTIRDRSALYPINKAIYGERLEILQDIVATGNADFTVDSPPSLYYAASRNNSAALTYLLEHGADPNLPYMRREGFPQASRDDCLSVNRESDNPLPASPLFAAVDSDNPAMTAELLRHGARPAADELPLLRAVKNNNEVLVNLLLAAKTGDVNAANAAGQTALHLAVQKKAPAMLILLLRQGADPSLADKKGLTPLALARQLEQADIVTILDGRRPFAAVALPAAPGPVLLDWKPLAPVPAPAAAAANPISAATVANAIPAATAVGPDTDTWSLTGKSRLTHTYELPSHRLTEVFNFETRERVVLSENIALKTETMGAIETFDTLSEEAVARALAEFRHLGGTTAEGDLGRNRLGKLKAGPGLSQG